MKRYLKILFITLLLSVLTTESSAKVSCIDTTKTSFKLPKDDIFLNELKIAIETGNFKNLQSYIDATSDFIINTNGDEVTYKSTPEQAVSALNDMVAQLPPAKVQVFKTSDSSFTAYTLKFILDVDGETFRVIFFLNGTSIYKIYLN